MSKKQALTEFHRGSILAAAERLFAEKGIEGTTMDDIAREAEYSKATLYVYFQSKEEIINAILLSSMILLQKKIREAIARSTGWYEGYDAVCHSKFGLKALPAILRFTADAAMNVPFVRMTVVSTMSKEEIDACRKLSEKVGADFFVRQYISQ